jgi:hypothetical protein
MDLVTPKAAAKHELLLNKPASGAHPKFFFTNEQGDQIGKSFTHWATFGCPL